MMVLVLLALLELVLGCHPDCVTCNGEGSANQCTSCAPNAYLDSTPLGHCLCMAGATTSSDALHCWPACDPTCLTCSGALSSQCLSCYGNASGAPGTCFCVSGYFPNLTSASCSICDSSCATCSGGLSSQCLTCKSNASGAPGTCVCQSGFYPNSTPALCTLCHVTCTACNGAGASACTSCYAGAALASGTTGPCECLAGSVPNPNSAHCTLATACHFSCSACSTPMDVTQCTDCYGLSVLSSFAPSPCICPLHAFPNPDVVNCAMCDITCQSCVWPGGPTECTSCLDFAALATSSPGVCICMEGAFPSPDSGHCAQCHTSCRLCVDIGEIGCSECYENADLTGPFPNACHCSPGFYPSPDAVRCAPCSVECATCLTSLECRSCKASAYLSAGQCLCSAGYFPSPDASLCTSCQANCQVCIVTGCIQCLPTYSLYAGTCLQTCPKAFLSIANVCEPVESPPLPSLSVDTANNLHINFDRDMLFNISAADITIQVSDNASLYDVVWSSPLFQSNRSFLVYLSINATELPLDNRVVFTFLRPEDVTDTNGVCISISTLFGSLFPIDSNSNSSSAFALHITSIVGRSSVAAALTSSLFTSKSGSIWSILNQMELITFIPMTSLPLPADLTEALNALVLEALLPDYFRPIEEAGVECDRGIDFAHGYKVRSRYFVSNVRMMLGVGVALVLFFTAFRALNLLKLPICANISGRILLYAHWKAPIRWWLQCYLHILVFSCLQLGISFSSQCLRSYYIDFNLVFALLGLSAALLTPLFLLFFLAKHQGKVTKRADLAFNRHWDELYKHLTPFSWTAALYPAIFLLRRLLFGLSVAYLYEWPKVQAVTGTALAFAVLLYVTLGRPIEGKMEWMGEIVVEIGTFAIFALSSCSAFEFSHNLKAKISNYAIWAILASILCNLIVSVVKMFHSVSEICREYKEKRRILPANAFLSHSNAAALRSTRISSIRIPF